MAKCIPNFNNISDLQTEWRLLQLEDLPDFAGRIDHFWSKIFEINLGGCSKYPHLTTVVKAILCLSHGNAEVERGFSQSIRIMTKDRNAMSEKTMNSILVVLDALNHVYHNRIEEIPIREELLILARNAHSSYESYLSEKKKQDELEADELRRKEEERKALEKRKRSIIKEKNNIRELEGKLKDVQQKEVTKNKAATELLLEAQQKLSKALKSNNILEATVAQGLLKAAQSVIEEEAKLKNEGSTLQKSVNKRKADLLDYFSKRGAC